MERAQNKSFTSFFPNPSILLANNKVQSYTVDVTVKVDGHNLTQIGNRR